MRSSAFKTKSGPEGVLRPARAAPEIAGCFTSDCGETSSGIGFASNSFLNEEPNCDAQTKLHSDDSRAVMNARFLLPIRAT
jgi:hypothetical protein